jgi:hypothetical protein
VYKVPQGLTAYDESLARQLIADFSAAEAQVSFDQAEAFERLVMQETAAEATLHAYSVLNSHHADALADTIGMLAGTWVLAVHYLSGGPMAAVGDLAFDSIEVVTQIGANSAVDPAYRNWVIGSAEVFTDYFATQSGDIPQLLERFLVADERAERARDGIRLLVERVEPDLGIGVLSTRIAPNGVWTVEGKAEGASFQLEQITALTDARLEEATDWFEHSQKVRDWNEAGRILSDLALVLSRGNNPYAVLTSVGTRIVDLVLGHFGGSVTIQGMECLATLAKQAGRAVFSAQPTGAGCEPFQNLPGLPRNIAPRLVIDAEAWRRQGPIAQTDLANYAAAVAAIEEAVASGEASAAAPKIVALAQAQAEVSASRDRVLAAMAAPPGTAWSAETHVLAQQYLVLNSEAIGLWIGLGGYLDDPNAAEPKALVTQQARRVTAVAAALEEAVGAVPATADSSAVVLIVQGEVAEATGVAGETIALTVTIENLGSLAAEGITVTVQSGGVVLATDVVPRLAPVQATETNVEFIAEGPGVMTVLVKASDGQQMAVDLLALKVEAAPEAATAELEQGTATAEPGVPAASCWPGAATVVLGVMGVAGLSRGRGRRRR